MEVAIPAFSAALSLLHSSRHPPQQNAPSPARMPTFPASQRLLRSDAAGVSSATILAMWLSGLDQHATRLPSGTGLGPVGLEQEAVVEDDCLYGIEAGNRRSPSRATAAGKERE